MNGFLNINKAADMTSHDVINRVRKIFHTKKAGHAGTLDPFATGVLPVAVGRATKFIEYLADCDKSYRAEILFGVETSTGDITGEIVNRAECQLQSINAVDSVLNSFVGMIEQIPPKYSAIKINGRKAYELARKNIEFDLPSRQVTIYKLNLIDRTENTLIVDVDCSKGTYIRSLAVEIGRRLNNFATLKSLQRTRVGNFFIDDSITLEELQKVGESALIDVESCLDHIEKFDLPSYRRKAFLTGLSTRIDQNFVDGKIFRVYVDNEFIGVGKIVDGEIKSDKIFSL